MRKIKLKNITQCLDVLNIIINGEKHYDVQNIEMLSKCLISNWSTIGSLITDDQENTDKYTCRVHTKKCFSYPSSLPSGISMILPLRLGTPWKEYSN